MKEKEFQEIILNDKYINGECKRINNTSVSYIDYNDFKKDYKKNMDKFKKKIAGEKYKNIIFKAINGNGYIIFYDEISAQKENGETGTLTAFCGLKLK